MNNKPNNMKGRQRGRNNGKPRPMGGGGGRNPNFDGGQRMRGNAQQLMEKYLALARDASSAGDRVLAENYFQHADHYYRVLNARFEQQQNNNGNRHQNYNQNGQGGHGQNYNQGYDGDQQPGFNDHPQGGQGGGHQQQPHHGQHQNPNNHQQPQYQQQPQQAPQYQQQPQHHHQQPQQHQPPQQQQEPAHTPPAAPQQAQSEDIGLPPGILGIGPPPGVPLSDNRPQGQGRAEGGEGEGRHGGRRRRGRGDRSAPAADAGE